MILLEIDGPVPAKKNMLRVTRFGTYHDKDIADQIEQLRVRAWIRWKQLHDGPAPVLEHPDLAVTFYVMDRRSDRDNKLTTILDVLQEAGVLQNDSIRRCNGTITLHPAIIGEVEKTVVEIWPRQPVFVVWKRVEK